MARTEVEVMEDWAPAIMGDQVPEAVDPEQASREIVRRILEAETADQVFEQANTTPAADLLGVPLQITGAVMMKSAYDEGPGAYLVIDVVNLETGERLAVSCGARNVMAQLYRLTQLGELPVRVRILEAGRPTANGYRPLWLERLVD